MIKLHGLMRRHGLMRLLILLVLAIMVIQAVPAKEEPKELKNATVKIQNILENESYFGKMVVIEGKIENECGSGCWFITNDGTGSIYVDIKPSNFVIPQKRGSTARVYGNVSIKEGDPYIRGKIVKIDGEIYQNKKS